jgi:hypothetical protein
MLRYILSLLLVLAISAPSYADTLIERFKNSEIYKTDRGTKKLVIGGEISNAYPFDSDGPMAPQSYKWSDVREIAPNVYQLARGEFGYTVYKNTGEIRIHPVRKRWDVYYSIAPKTPVALTHQQHSDKLLELYVSTPQVRYSFFIGDQGFKVNNRLKASYSGGNVWSHTYNVALEGLIRTGRTIYFNGDPVGKLPDPFMVDAEGTVAPVVESIDSGELTITATGIDSLVLPIDVDPVLTPPASNLADGQMYEALPNLNYGSLNNFGAVSSSGGLIIRGALRFDASAIPVGSTITSASLEAYAWFNFGAGPAGRTYEVNRITQTGWVESQFTWNDYSTGNAWASGGGDFTTTDQSTFTGLAAPSWFTWNDAGMIAQVQYAVDNVGGIIHMLVKDADETAASSIGAAFYTKEEATQTTLRPKMAIEFEDSANCSWRLDQYPPVWCF